VTACRTARWTAPEDPVAVPEADLGFGGMDVDVHVLGRQGDHHHGQRIPPGGDEGVVGLNDGVGQARVLYPAAVDEEGDLPPVGPVKGVAD
jgi:hypothetical protein